MHEISLNSLPNPSQLKELIKDGKLSKDLVNKIFHEGREAYLERFLLEEINNNLHDFEYLKKIVVILDYIPKESIQTVENLNKDVTKISHVTTVSLFALFALNFGVQNSLDQSQFQDLPFIMQFLINSTGNLLPTLGIPVILMTLFDKIQYLNNSAVQQKKVETMDEVNGKLYKYIEFFRLILPYLLITLLFIYNIDVETIQVLPYGNTVDWPGTPDVYDLVAGFTGLVGAAYIITKQRQFYAKAFIVGKINKAMLG